MAFKAIKSDTPTNTLIAAMEHAGDASSVLVVITKDRDPEHEVHLVFANDALTVERAAWLLDCAKMNLHRNSEK